MASVDYPEVLVPDAAAWRAWLVENHDGSAGVRLVLHKKGGSVTTLDYDGALNEALCFGWIDGTVRRRDEGSYTQQFTPRRPRSAWSARNVGLVADLTAEGRMAPAGLAAVAAAQSDGRWDAAYAGPATITVPEDVSAALAAVPDAAAVFARLTSQNRFAILYRVGQAKRPETRDRRVAEFVAMLARGEAPYPQSGLSVPSAEAAAPSAESPAAKSPARPKRAQSRSRTGAREKLD
ncbi:MAG: hypothetical protein JWN95_2573 [Frankiales bacterium]|nr:hypothetical protein [Frankiales bacterium]